VGILGSLAKIWKKKNQLRAKISPVARSIDKELGWDKMYELPGLQFKPNGDPDFQFSEDAQNVLRLGNATVNAGGYRAVSPDAKSDGKFFPGRVLVDTLSSQAGGGTVMPTTTPGSPQPQVGYPSLGPPTIPSPRAPAFGLSSIGAANRRPYTM